LIIVNPLPRSVYSSRRRPIKTPPPAAVRANVVGVDLRDDIGHFPKAKTGPVPSGTSWRRLKRYKGASTAARHLYGDDPMCKILLIFFALATIVNSWPTEVRADAYSRCHRFGYCGDDD
jgi:hypothetical protein